MAVVVLALCVHPGLGVGGRTVVVDLQERVLSDARDRLEFGWRHDD